VRKAVGKGVQHTERLDTRFVARTFKPAGSAGGILNARRQVDRAAEGGRSMRIGVIGATGETGRHLLRLAVEDGHHVTALARTPSRLAGISGIRVERADARDPASLAQAVAGGLDAIGSIVGAGTLFEARRVTDLYVVSTRNLVDACRAASAPRLVVVSSAGVEPQPNDGFFYTHVLKRFFLQRMYDDMRRMEALLEDSALGWTIVRPLTSPTVNRRAASARASGPPSTTTGPCAAGTWPTFFSAPSPTRRPTCASASPCRNRSPAGLSTAPM
jgi:putative NADH-flavin reductase